MSQVQSPGSGGSVVVNGVVVQKIIVQDSTPDSTTEILVVDRDTAPVITAGKEIFTATVTPDSATNRLLITAHCLIDPSIGDKATAIALFKTGTTDSLSTLLLFPEAGPSVMEVAFSGLAGDTSAQTYSIRMGVQAGVGGTCFFNQSRAGKTLGNTYVSVFTIEELEV